MANKRFNGNVLIAKGDTVLYEKSYGLANREFEIANSRSTKFVIGSITKPLVAYTLLLLEQRGSLSLDDRLSKYFPDFPDADSVSIKQLLNHTSGITDYHAFEEWRNDSKLDITPAHTLSTIRKRPYIFKPGDRFSYSNSGYLFLGLIMEQVSGQSFEDLIQQELLDPLQLYETGIASNTRIIEKLASGYTTTPRETGKAEYINYRQPYTSGNMYSTPRDLRKFTKAVMHNALLTPE
ncbi:MAG: beta-lactamase family protein [Flavobacteriales bacterium]|nr:beta-lactamase family protein [Flavobacteriales bacterium]